MYRYNVGHLAYLPHHIEPLPEMAHSLLIHIGAVNVVLK